MKILKTNTLFKLLLISYHSSINGRIVVVFFAEGVGVFEYMEYVKENAPLMTIKIR
jgi:hypothetical protein